nr:putative reverse transcriptase domain-containing protein [Tanacetum cinerariifolium]
MVDTAYPKSWIRCMEDLVSFMVFGECMHRYVVSSLMDTRIGCQNRAPCHTCFNYNRPCHFAKDCRDVPRNMNLVNARNLTARGCKLEIEGYGFDINLIPFGSGSFDVFIRMDWLSDHKAEIICHEKVVRIPLLDGKVLRVLGEKPEEKMRQLMSVKAKEQKQEKIMVVKDFLSKIEAVKNWEAPRTPSEVCSFLGLASDYDCQICYHPGKVNVVADALSRKERVNPKRVRAMNMTLQSSIKDRILAAQKEACDKSAWLQKGLYEMVKRRSDGALYYLDRIWVPLKGDVRTLIMDKAYKLKYSVHPGADKMYYDLRDMYWWLGMKKDIAVYTSKCLTCLKSMQEALGTRLDMSTAYHPQTDGQGERTIQKLEDMLRACVLDFGGSWDVHLPLVDFSYNNSYHSSVRCASFDALYAKKCRSSIMWGEVGEGQLIGPELVQETTKKISQIKDRLKAVRFRQKSYVDKRRKPLDFSVGNYVLLKVSPWKGVVRFRKKGKLAPRFVKPFEITERIDHVEILEREFKKLKRSRIAIVEVWWNSKRGPEFTWEHEDQMKLKTLTGLGRVRTSLHLLAI